MARYSWILLAITGGASNISLKTEWNNQNKPSLLICLRWCNVWDAGLGIGLAIVGHSYSGPFPFMCSKTFRKKVIAAVVWVYKIAQDRCVVFGFLQCFSVVSCLNSHQNFTSKGQPNGGDTQSRNLYKKLDCLTWFLVQYFSCTSTSFLHRIQHSSIPCKKLACTWLEWWALIGRLPIAATIFIFWCLCCWQFVVQS